MDSLKKLEREVEKSKELFDALVLVIKDIQKNYPDMQPIKIIEIIVKLKFPLLIDHLAQAFSRAGDSDKEALEKATKLLTNLAISLTNTFLFV